MPKRLTTRLLVAIAAGLQASAVVSAAPVVYHSPGDDGNDPGAPATVSEPSDILYLYLDAGPSASASGTECNTGSGDEICSWQISLLASGNISITGFTPDPGMDVVSKQTATSLIANGVHATTGRLGPTRIGELQLAVSGSGSLDLSEGVIVGANLTLKSVSPTALALPEPSTTALLMSGVVALLTFGRRRFRQ
jgi:hypothetical protein